MWLISICFVSPSIVGGSGREHCACGISLVALNSRDLDKGKGCPRHLHAPKLCPQLCGGRCFFSFSFVFISVNAKHACGGGEVTNFDVVSVVCFCGSGVFFGSYCSD